MPAMMRKIYIWQNSFMMIIWNAIYSDMDKRPVEG